MSGKEKDILYTKYPLKSILLYNGTTIIHFLVGAWGIILGYNYSLTAVIIGISYTVFALLHMYFLMPLKVCPNCVYFFLQDSICISGMNIWSKKIAPPGDTKLFSNRGKGLFCSNNLYMGSLILPILAIVPALIANFSLQLILIALFLVALMVFRIFVLFFKVACIYCHAKHQCPNAQSMGLSK